MKSLFVPLRYLPDRCVAGLSAVLGGLLFAVLRKRRRTAIENVSRAFGSEMSARDARRLARKSFVNMVRVGLEFIQLPRWRGRVGEKVIAESPENLREAWKRGKGVLMLASHLGNWEYGIAWGPAAGYGTVMVARLPSNGIARGLAVETRTMMGVEMVPRKKGMRGILRGLNEGKLVVVALDQHVIDDSVAVEFFGRPAATSRGVALLALKYDVPVVPSPVWRDGNRFRVRFLPPIELERTGDLEKDIEVNTRKFVRVIEEYIRKHPDQWLWMHRRWRLD